MQYIQYLIELILGLFCGLFLGITSLAPTGIILIALEILKIGDYKSNLGSILLLNIFPITIPSVYEFYKSNKINYSFTLILLLSITIGCFIGSKMVVGNNSFLTSTNIKYITGYLSIFMGIIFLISAYKDK